MNAAYDSLVASLYNAQDHADEASEVAVPLQFIANFVEVFTALF
jgi:hypothetical protein